MKDKGLYEIILLLPRDFKKSNSNNIKSRYIYYGPHTVKYFNQLSPLTSQQPYFMGEATKKERLNELLTITKFQAETRKRLVGRRDPKAVAWAPPSSRTGPQTQCWQNEPPSLETRVPQLPPAD